MPDGHHIDCDQNHKPRQACNDNLASRSNPTIVSPPEPLSPRTIESEPVRASSIIVDNEVLPDEVVERVEVASASMPDPSPWASRAWEDTAAAVGDTGSGAKPLAPGADESAATGPSPQRVSPMACAIALAACIGLLLLLRRRRRSRKMDKHLLG